MKITNPNPYQGILDEIFERGGDTYNTYVIRVRLSTHNSTNTTNVIYVGGDPGYYDYDFYEGEEVELLGWINIEDVVVPEIT